MSLKIAVVFAALAACTPTRDTVGGSPDAAAPPTIDAPVQATAFIKHGDNGDASCATFCAGAEWGRVGTCLGAALNNFPCSQAMGKLTNGMEQRCTCSDGTAFTKDGDNGTASCDQFCAGAQWGPTGTCVEADLQSNASATIDGAVVNYDTDCALTPGMIANAGELTCICSAS